MGVSDSRHLEVDPSDPDQLKERGDSFLRHAEEKLENRPFYKSTRHSQEDAADCCIQAATSFKLAKKCML